MFSEALLSWGLMHVAVLWTQLVTQAKDTEKESRVVITLSLHDDLLRLSPDEALGIYFKCYQHVYKGIYFQTFLMLPVMWVAHPQN